MKYTFASKSTKIIFVSVFFSFSKVAAQPAISSFAPASGPPGTIVVISGTGFNPVAANNIVFFGAVKASVTAATTTSVSVMVPAGATYQPVTLLDFSTGLMGYASKPFRVTFPNPAGVGIPAHFFKTKVDFATATNPFPVAIGDIDGDGKPELVVVNTNSNTVSVYRNTSTQGVINSASFAAKVDFASGNFSKYLGINDMDGDGKPDLIVVNSNNVSVLRNTSTMGIINAGSFAAIVNFDLNFTGPAAVAIRDLDGDGKPDMAAANSAANSISVLRNTSTPGILSAAAKVDFAAGSTPVFISMGDIDGDGKPEMIVSNANVGGNSVSVLQNTSIAGAITATSFAARIPFTTGPIPRSIALGDVDEDGKTDLIVANSDAVSTTFSVLRNLAAAGSITAGAFAAKIDFSTGLNPYAVALGDLDGDGKPDIVSANSGSNSISVFRNTSTVGTISTITKVDFTTGLQPRSVAIGDLDGDGIPEVATANFAGNSISVFRLDFVAVPLTLTNVKAYQKNRGVQVDWSVQQEINILSYEIERSQNGQHFVKVQTVAPTGNSNATADYNVFDPNPANGLNFYRIKIIEAGKLAYSPVMKVNVNPSAKNSMSIYPNPILNNSISLETNLPNGKYYFILINNQGQHIITRSFNHEAGAATENFLIDKNLARGVYRVKLIGEGIELTTVLIKN